MHALILLQQADGTWELTEELASIIGRDLDELRSVVNRTRDADVLRAWATALAVVWLSRNARGAEDEWRLLASKAQRWLARTASVPPRACDVGGGGRRHGRTLTAFEGCHRSFRLQAEVPSAKVLVNVASTFRWKCQGCQSARVQGCKECWCNAASTFRWVCRGRQP